MLIDTQFLQLGFSQSTFSCFPLCSFEVMLLVASLKSRI
jgi:hypothetical protein